jgi:hypothetical protein
MRRIFYLGYYLKTLDRKKFLKFIRFVSLEKDISKLKLLIDVIVSSLKYNISFLEYFQFRFYELNPIERKTWAGTGYMYEYQRIMNPPEARIILDDKTLFYREYKPFIRHTVSDISDLGIDGRISESILTNPSGKIAASMYLYAVPQIFLRKE